MTLIEKRNHDPQKLRQKKKDHVPYNYNEPSVIAKPKAICFINK